MNSDPLYAWYQYHSESPFGPNGESGLDPSDEQLERESAERARRQLEAKQGRSQKDP